MTTDSGGGNTLRSGHRLVAKRGGLTSWLLSRSLRFDLTVWGGGLQLQDNVQRTRMVGAGYPTWARYAENGRSRSATLTMQRDGNLVLRGDNGRIAWSSHTNGRGNYARLLDDGRFVVRNRNDVTIWSSGTSAVLMVTGDKLLPGHLLSNHTGHTVTRLIMGSGGNLVLRNGSRRVWQTDTHVRGSYLTVTEGRRLAVVKPNGHVAWHSLEVGHGPLLTVARNGRITLTGVSPSDRCWVRPVGASRDCDTG